MLVYEKMRNNKYVEKQYRNVNGLSIRKNLHERYSVNEKGFLPWLFEQYKFVEGCSVIELGSGMGDLWKDHINDIASKSKLVLSDFSAGMVESLERKYSSYPIDIKKIDIQNIPYDDDTFDIAIANSMLYHVPNIDKALFEVSRILNKGGVFYTATTGENGLAKFIYDSLKELQLVKESKINISFTLQNGDEQLRRHFGDVQLKYYYDKLEITETEDLVDYIYSMASMKDLDKCHKPEMIEYYDAQKNASGVIEIQKEYGTFIAVK